MAGSNYNVGAGTLDCWPDAFSEHDPNLTPVLPSPGNEGEPDRSGLLDSAGDRPANPSSTLGFSVNLTKCMNHGDEREAWNVGETKDVAFTAAEGLGDTAGSSSSQEVFFRLQQ